MKFVAFMESIILTLSCFFGSLFNLPDQNVQNLIEQNGRMIYGICHPNEDYDLLADAGLDWVRFDIPCPYDATGSIRKAYKSFKERCQGYKDHGFKVMAVTPYPRDYIADMGFNPVENEENIQRTKDLAVFLYNDLKEITDAFQITNEMGVGSFMLPLNTEQAALYIGIQLEAIHEAKGDDFFPIGYNSADLLQGSMKLHKLMKPYLSYCDYVGIDLYTGNTGDAKPSDYAKKVKKLYRMTNKPIIIEEFGFWSEGGPKTDEQKAAILKKYGYTSEAEAIAAGSAFIVKLPKQFQDSLKTEYPNQEEQWAEIVLTEKANHFYGISSEKTIERIPHTPEGQAKYFQCVMTELQKLNCLAGMVIYCCSDMNACFYCGHEWCPFETRWGLFDIDGKPKPAYYAVREVITGKRPI